MKKVVLKGILLICITSSALAQKAYNFSVNLNEIKNDKITIELIAPALKAKEAVYHLPKIVPGTYAIHNYGSFVTNFQAFDKKGNALKVEHPDKNTWKIAEVKKLYKISYQVDDSWDTPSIQEDIFEPAGTNIQPDTVFILNNFGFFGYFEGYEKTPYQVAITKPTGFYGSTSLVLNTKNSTTSKDIFEVKDYHTLVDAPIMYCRPDTTFLKIGDTDVLISVFSPNKKANSKILAKDIQPVLEAQRAYLGGKLPVDKYAFIIYLTDWQNLTRYGALEHGQSSFYFLPERFSQEELSKTMKDVASHEFFHVVTPLNIHSEEIGNFDYITPKMSKHLWLYEGLTEYAAHHAQLYGGVIDLESYLNTQIEKILLSTKQFDDKLSFTELSAKALDEHKEQYQNVYYKGALIGLCLDVKLHELSGGKYGTQELMRDLAKTYGKDKSFKDDELFDVITKLTYPEIRDFFKKHVEGNEPLPLKETFQTIGVNYNPNGQKTNLELGFGVAFGLDAEQKFLVGGIDEITDLGKRLDFQVGDVILSFNGKPFDYTNYQPIFEEYQNMAKKGDIVTIVVKRSTEGKSQEVTLKADLREQTTAFPELKALENPSAEQLKLREAWMGRK